MHNMRKKQQFVRPAVLQETILLSESPILAGSLVDNTTIVSTGQEVENYDFSGDTFNHEWE